MARRCRWAPGAGWCLWCPSLANANMVGLECCASHESHALRISFCWPTLPAPLQPATSGARTAMTKTYDGWVRTAARGCRALAVPCGLRMVCVPAEERGAPPLPLCTPTHQWRGGAAATWRRPPRNELIEAPPRGLRHPVRAVVTDAPGDRVHWRAPCTAHCREACETGDRGEAHGRGSLSRGSLIVDPMG